jgi:hypothetical protein
MDIEKFTLPIKGQAQCGCGFFVGNHFITAGHVVLECNLPLEIWFNGDKYQLEFDNLAKIVYTKELTENCYCGDFAVFAFENINSPLVLADYIPTTGQKLNCITYDTIVSKSGSMPSIFATDEEIMKVKTTATVREEQQGNFFACDTDTILHKGNSGSPLIDTNNRVVGILHAGTQIPECCVFQNTISIKQFMK